MRKFFLLTAVFFTLQVNSQNITFSGAGLTSVKVENLTSGNGLTVDVAPDDILSLGSAVGISEIKLNASELFVYPNPTSGNSTVLFTPPQ